MLLFLLLTKVVEELVEGLNKILVQALLIKDHPLKPLIHLPLESQEKEITVQDLMINKKLLLTNYSSPFQKRNLVERFYK